MAYATPSCQIERQVRLVRGGTVEEAICRSGLLEQFPEIDLARNRVGIHGELVELDIPLHGGERVEIYRPLLADPKEARRRRDRKRTKRG